MHINVDVGQSRRGGHFTRKDGEDTLSAMCKTVTLVGHCLPDSSYLKMAVKALCPDAKVQRVNDDEAFATAVRTGTDLLLINRVLDGHFTTHYGVDLIKDIRQTNPGIRTMLISNYPDAQKMAEESGALPGFGKAEIGSRKAIEALASALGSSKL